LERVCVGCKCALGGGPRYPTKIYVRIIFAIPNVFLTAISTFLPPLLRFLHVFHHHYNSYTSHTATANPTLPLLLRILLMLAVEFLHVFYYHCDSHTFITATNSTDISSRIPTRFPSLLRFPHFHYCYEFY
jgi:hypothetical protein